MGGVTGGGREGAGGGGGVGRVGVPGGGGPGWRRSAVGLVQVGVVRLGVKISRFFFLSQPFFPQIFEVFQVFLWTSVGGLGVLISKDCAKHRRLGALDIL